MTKVTACEAKTRFGELLEPVSQGKEIVSGVTLFSVSA